MWDHATGRSRGYGFVSFRTRAEAEAGIARMHGQFIGSRRVRCGWAQHKQVTAHDMERIQHTACMASLAGVRCGWAGDCTQHATHTAHSTVSQGPLRLGTAQAGDCTRHVSHTAAHSMHGQSCRVLCGWAQHKQVTAHSMQRIQHTQHTACMPMFLAQSGFAAAAAVQTTSRQVHTTCTAHFSGSWSTACTAHFLAYGPQHAQPKHLTAA
jgi:hypothetical protein